MDNKLLSLLLVLCVTHSARAATWTAAQPTCTDVAPPSAFGSFTVDMKTVTLFTNGIDPMPVTTLCPGVTYNMKVYFPEKRVYSISSSVGTFAGTAGTCLNRATTAAASGASSVGLKLTVPCNAKASGSVVFRIASASASANTTANYNFQAFPMLVSPVLMCPKSKCPGAPTTLLNVTSVGDLGLAGLINRNNFVDVVKNLGSELKTELTSLPQQLSALTNAMETIAAVVNPSNKSVAVPDPAQFLTALRHISSLVNIGSGASTGNGGIFGLLDALQTISSATGSTGTASGSRSLFATATSDSTTSSEPAAVNSLLNAVKTVGNLLVGSSTTTAAPSLPGLLQSGMGLITSLSRMIPVGGASINLNLASILSLLQYTGSFFSQLTALLPGRG